jgi:hypothetical protein
MLLSDEEIQERLESPLNLLNRLRTATTPRPPAGNGVGIPCLPPKTEDLDIDVEGEVAVSQLRGKAARIMGRALNALEGRVQDIEKPERLARIAAEMHKVVANTEDPNKAKTSQIIVYAPQIIQESHFQELTLKEDSQ